MKGLHLKRFLSIVLCILMVAALLPMNTMADDTATPKEPKRRRHRPRRRNRRRTPLLPAARNRKPCARRTGDGEESTEPAESTDDASSAAPETA